MTRRLPPPPPANTHHVPLIADANLDPLSFIPKSRTFDEGAYKWRQCRAADYGGGGSMSLFLNLKP